MIQCGELNEPIPGGTRVFRLARPESSTGEPTYTAFELSTEDRVQEPPKLSVWLDALTQPEQAREVIPHPQSYTFALYLKTDTVRTIHQRLPGPPQMITPLDVVWDPLPTPPQYSHRPRWLDGHCGVTGLLRPPQIERKVYKTLRTLLFRASEIVRLF